MRAQGRKLALVAWPLDAVFVIARIIVAALVGTLMVLALYQGVSLELPGWVAVFIVAPCLLYVVLTKMPGLSDSVDRAFSQVRRAVRLACDDASVMAADERKFACRFVPTDLRAPFFRYDKQRDVVRLLKDSAIKSQGGDFWVIEGPSGSGKTRTAYLLTDALIQDRSEFVLAEKVRYFDLVAGDGADHRAVRALAGSRLDGTITIVDNFHRVGPQAIESLTKILLDSPVGPQTRLLVLLARPTETWKLSPGTDVRLVSEARRRGRHVELGGAPSLHVRHALAYMDEDLAARIGELGGGGVASAAQLHLSRVAAANPRMPNDVARVVGLLSAGVRGAGDRRLAMFLGVVAALSMHRGFFSRSQFGRAARLVARGVGRRDRLETRLSLWATLWRMRRMGLIPWVRTGRGRYVFHEAVAQLVIERLNHEGTFGSSFREVGMDRLANQDHAGADIGWMIAAELGAVEELDARFDAATLSGAFAPMASTLARIADRQELPDSARMQLALLFDRTGNFARAREIFDQGGFAEQTGRRAAEHRTARIEVSHDDEARAEAAKLRRNSDPLIAAAGRYWELHMEAHAGAFASDELREMSADMLPLVDGADRWAVFTLARVHFDHMRHLYLSGEATAERIAAAANSEVSDVLAEALPTFSALSLLYTQAHFCAHVVLPRRAIDHSLPTHEEAELLGVDASSLSTVVEVADLALRLYERARDEFWQYGDREARYLDGDVVNAELMVASGELLESAESKLHRYADFIRESGFGDLASLPSMYFCRYHAICYFADVIELGETGRTTQEHLDEARRHLREATELDEAAGNAYGQLRAEVFAMILDAAQQRLSASALEDLRLRTRQLDYAGLSRVLERLAASSRLTNMQARVLLRFVPVVHQ